MNSEITPDSHDLLQTHPALSVLRLAALAAGPDGALDGETLDLLVEQVQSGGLVQIAPTEMWPELVRGMMAQNPSNMFRVLRDCGALPEVLPEVSALFGIPQIADDPPQVDIGQHLLRVLDEAANCNAPLPVRFAALVMNVGKFDSPPEHLPVHYKHIDRGRPRIRAIAERFGTGDDCLDLALTALVECERVHRVSEIRAGPVAAMLERLGAFDRPSRFEQLMTLCACDYRAYRGRDGRAYPKASLLKTALNACSTIDESDVTAGMDAAQAGDALQAARALAIAKAFRSERWAG